MEAIADNKAKLDLLTILYDCTQDYPLVKIITSCRTSDKAAFLKIEGNYGVHSYEISNLSLEEINNIAQRYPLIGKMQAIEAYKEFLISPFYVNIIVSEIKDINNIKDENQFREYIWKNVICKRGQIYKETIKDIVFERAKALSVGVSPDKYDETVISTLISDGILIKNLNTIRLKYDIFEDICFEHFFDVEFDKCRGDYNLFFSCIEKFGTCVFRRYQIWIENKLLAKNNREKFLYQLNFSDKIPAKWQKQTRIGLVKSRHSEDFFKDYGKTIIEKELLVEFLEYTNLYAFEIDGKSLSRYVILLKPCGTGRKCLIHLIAKEKWYKNNKTANKLIVKLCTDYTNCTHCEQQTAEECVEILGWMTHTYLSDSKNKDYYKIGEVVKKLLTPIYKIANYATFFIEEFWKELQQWYQSGKQDKISLAGEIIEDTLKFEHYNLARYLPKQICNLAEFFWTYTPKLNDRFLNGIIEGNSSNHLTYWYGLSINAENYEHGESRGSALYKTFFFYLFRTNFWHGLEWTIQFVNKAVKTFQTKSKENLPLYTIYFDETKSTKSYLGYENLWLATSQEFRVPMVISDLLYCLKSELREIIKVISKNKTILEEFTKKIKGEIFSKSNNIALLTIISEIGMEFNDVLPGYALDIASNIDLIIHDLTRKTLCMKNPQKERLEKKILLSVGLPFDLNQRYNNFLEQTDLMEYFVKTHITGGEKLADTCRNIVDYLYSIIPNDKEHAKQHLQIQKIDLRKAKLVTDNTGNIYIHTQVKGEAKNLSRKKIISDLDSEISEIITNLVNNIKEKTISADCMAKSIIELSRKIEKSNMAFLYENNLVMLIAYSFTMDELKTIDRRELCQIWINGIYRIMNMGSFNFELGATPILFAQMNCNSDFETKNAIKQLILDCILYNGQNGIISKIAQMAHEFIYENTYLGKALFNTIVKLSEDRMKHEKYNSKYLGAFETKGNKEINFSPNRQPYLKGVDIYLEENGKQKYKSNKVKIIQKYLYNEENINLSNFDMQNHDISLMSYALNCRKSIYESDIYTIVKKFLIEMIDLFHDSVPSYSRYDYFSAYQEYEIKSLLQRDFIAGQEKTENVLKLMFEDMNFSKFNSDVLDFYREVFADLFMVYFDAHSNPIDRSKCEKIIYSLEARVRNISEYYVKKELYKSLTLSLPKYAGRIDTSKYKSGYTYQDKQFLNDIFSKYGVYHIDEILATIYKLDLDKLLPEIIISLNNVLKTHVEHCKKLGQIVDVEQSWIILLAVTKVFLDYNNEVKKDIDLTSSYESILQILRDLGYAEAAVIFDEFKIH